jgi:hypothetical protein
MTKVTKAPALQTRSVALQSTVAKGGEQTWIDRASAQSGF